MKTLCEGGFQAVWNRKLEFAHRTELKVATSPYDLLFLQ